MDNDDITYVRPELETVLPRYVEIRDCIELTVKGKGEVYLPMPNPTDRSESNAARYNAYVERAIFYDVSALTLSAMVTQVYARDPEIKLPPLLEPLREDATGSGLSLVQLSKDSTRDAVGFGRGGIYVDYPSVDRPVTKAELQRGSVKPTFTIYAPDNIINWREERRGSKLVKTLVVLRENIDVEGEFSLERTVQYRELRLVGGFLRIQIWRRKSDIPLAVTADGNSVFPAQVENSDEVVRFGAPIFPRDAQGRTFTEIPFEFIGSVNNDSTIDDAPLYGLCMLNIGHYRNSADYEESCFIAGQPTPWFSGLTEDWVTNVLKGEVLLGSRAAVPLPENSQAGLLQVQPNSMPMEAMRHKEAQMVALGARLVENRQVRRTLGEVKETSAAQTSILASCANNVSAAFTRALKWAALFVGADASQCVFKLNTDFALTELSGDERAALLNEYMGGLLGWVEVRSRLRRGGLAFEDDAAVLAEAQKRLAAEVERTAKLKQKTTQLEGATNG